MLRGPGAGRKPQIPGPRRPLRGGPGASTTWRGSGSVSADRPGPAAASRSTRSAILAKAASRLRRCRGIEGWVPSVHPLIAWGLRPTYFCGAPSKVPEVRRSLYGILEPLIEGGAGGLGEFPGVVTGVNGRGTQQPTASHLASVVRDPNSNEFTGGIGHDKRLSRARLPPAMSSSGRTTRGRRGAERSASIGN